MDGADGGDETVSWSEMYGRWMSSQLMRVKLCSIALTVSLQKAKKLKYKRGSVFGMYITNTQKCNNKLGRSSYGYFT